MTSTRRGVRQGFVPFLSAVFLFFLALPGPFEVNAAVYVHGTPLTLGWTAASGAVDHYNVYVSLNQQPFVLQGNVPSNSCSMAVQDGARYVVMVEASGAGGQTGPLSDPSDEIVVYLNGSADDTDGDGMPNVWEVSHGFNPYSPADAAGDPDGDGLSNHGEFLAGTAPKDPDSDKDGVLDGTEVQRGQNPLNPGDNAPVANAGQDRQLDPTVVTLDGSGSWDPNGDVLSFSWTQVQGYTVELSDPRSVRPTFLGKKWGEYRFRLVVNDGRVGSAPDEVSITIRNVQPTADAGQDQVVDAGTQVTLDAGGSQDPNGDPLTFSWLQVEGLPVALSGAQSRTASFVPTSAGVYGFRAVACDGVNYSAPDQVQVTVHALNQVPTAQAGTDQTVRVEDLVTLDGTGSTDPDGDFLEYSWAQFEGPETVALEGESDPHVRFSPRQTGKYRFHLVVRDGKVASAPDEVTVTAASKNDPPVSAILSVGPVQVGDWVVLSGSGSYDPDGDPLTYQWSQTGGPKVTLENATKASAGFYAVSEGVLTFQLVVHDGELESQPSQVQVTVNGVNQVPVADAGQDLEGVLKGQVCLDGSGSYDPDAGETLTYSWSQTAGPRITLSGANTAMPCFKPRDAGEYQFQLVVSDGRLNSAPDQVTILVQGNNGSGKRGPKNNP